MDSWSDLGVTVIELQAPNASTQDRVSPAVAASDISKTYTYGRCNAKAICWIRTNELFLWDPEVSFCYCAIVLITAITACARGSNKLLAIV